MNTKVQKRKKTIKYVLSRHISPKLDGFRLLVDGILIADKVKGHRVRLNADVFTPLAKADSTTIRCVEQNIRYALKSAGCKDTPLNFVKTAVGQIRLG